jgi:hypothetical protein
VTGKPPPSSSLATPGIRLDFKARCVDGGNHDLDRRRPSNHCGVMSFDRAGYFAPVAPHDRRANPPFHIGRSSARTACPTAAVQVLEPNQRLLAANSPTGPGMHLRVRAAQIRYWNINACRLMHILFVRDAIRERL